MLTYYTTGDLATLTGLSTASARNRVRDGLWKPSARTRAGDSLFTDKRAAEIAKKESERGARLPRGARAKIARRAAAPAPERAE